MFLAMVRLGNKKTALLRFLFFDINNKTIYEYKHLYLLQLFHLHYIH